MLEIIELIGRVVDQAGVSVMVIGILAATLLFLYQRLRGGVAAFERYRQGIGRSILLGLEILIAADIIGTVVIKPTWQNVGVLGLIVLIRTFLSATLELEPEATVHAYETIFFPAQEIHFMRDNDFVGEVN